MLAGVGFWRFWVGYVKSEVSTLPKSIPREQVQTCPNCGAHTGAKSSGRNPPSRELRAKLAGTNPSSGRLRKKELDERVHNCSECEDTTDRDVAAAIVVEQRGLAEILRCGFASPKDFQENSRRTDGNAGCGG